MEKEDRLIKDLIKEGFLKSAPDNFTENVMNAVAKTEIREKSIFGDNGFSYAAITVMAISLAGSIIYFVDPSFYSFSLATFTGFLKQIIISFTSTFSGYLKLNIVSDSSFLVGGIIAIILLLLLFDRLLSKNRKVIGLFV